MPPFAPAAKPGRVGVGATGRRQPPGHEPAGASPSGVFTSDLSVSEYVLLGEAGFEPLGFVVGSSIYHVGLQVGRWGRNQELQVLTQTSVPVGPGGSLRVEIPAMRGATSRSHERRDSCGT